MFFSRVAVSHGAGFIEIRPPSPAPPPRGVKSPGVRRYDRSPPVTGTCAGFGIGGARPSWRLLTPRRTRCPRFTQDARQGNGPPDSISIHNGQPGRPRRTVRARSAITLPPIALVRPARRARSGVSSTRRDPGPPECPPDELRFACRKVAHHLDLMRQAWREGDAKQLDLIGSGIGSETGYFEHLMRCEIRAEVHRLREKLEHDLDYLPLILPHVEPRLRDRLCRLMSALDLDRSVATDEGERTAWRLIWTALGLDSEVNELISILKAEGDRIALVLGDAGTLCNSVGGTISQLPTDADLLESVTSQRTPSNPNERGGKPDPVSARPTAGDLAGEVGISDDTFRRVRNAAEVTVTERGAAARKRRYSEVEVDRLVEAAREGNFIERNRMVKLWAKWASDPPNASK